MQPFTPLIKPSGSDCNIDCPYCFYKDRSPEVGRGRQRMDGETIEKLVEGYVGLGFPVVGFAWQGGDDFVKAHPRNEGSVKGLYSQLSGLRGQNADSQEGMMKHLKCLAIVLALFTLACGGGEEAELAPVGDIVAAAPDNAKMLLENDSVSVVFFTLPSQGQLPMHEGRDRVVYSLSDYKLEFQIQAGQAEIRDFRQGELHWHSAGTHAVRNVGPITAEYLVVSRKGPNPTPGVTSNLAELMPDKAKIVFENQDAKVIEVSLEPGDKQPPHVAASRVVYSITPAKLKFISGEETIETVYAAGEVDWLDGGEHQVECLSEEPVRYLVFELM